MSQTKQPTEFDCTQQCHSEQHGDLLTAAITKRAVSDAALASFFKSSCYNFTRNVDKEGRTLLHMAASRGRRSLVEWLLRQYSSSQGVLHIDARDKESGYTALHRSIFYGQINTSVALIQLGASTSILDNDDLCAIDHAILDRPRSVMLSKDASCEVYVWGTNTNYTSGTSSQHHRHYPELLTSFTKQNVYIKQVCLSKFHSVFVSEFGGVWACGHGEGGRLGVARGNTCVLPTALSLSDCCMQAAVGRDHTILLMQTGTILSCGLNDHHQLGQVPPPLLQLIPRAVKLRLVGARGVCAARYHSVAWSSNALYTWGLNGGQLGHPKNENRTIIIPQKVLRFEECMIISVSVSDGATVAATNKGDVYLMHQFQCKKIVSRQHNIKHVSVIGGEVIGGDKLTDAQKQLTVLLLTTLGNIYLWQDTTNQMLRCIFSMSRPVVVVETALTREFIMITTKHGEVFHGSIMPKKPRPLKLSSKPDKIRDKTPTLKSDFHKFIEKDDCILIKLKRLPNIHRAVDVYCDNKGNNFAVLQVSPSTGINNLPQVTSSQITSDMLMLLEQSSEFDLLHDVIIMVGQQIFPTHSYVISYGSEYFSKLCNPTTRERNINEENSKIMIIINNVHPKIFEQILLYLYTGDCTILTVGPCKIQIKQEINNMNNKNISLPDNSSEYIINNSEILSAFEVNQNKNKKPKSKKDKINKEKHQINEEFLDPVRLLREAAKKLQVTSLYEKLMNFKYELGNVVIVDSSDKKSMCNKVISFDRQNFPELWDTTLKCSDGNIIRAHKCILFSRLDYFNGMFSNTWSENSTNATISLPMTKQLLEPIIDFLYTDECPIIKESDDIEFLYNILVISDQLFISRLKEMCEFAFASYMTLKNVTEIFQLANTYNCPQLNKHCMEYISLNLPTLLENKSLETIDKNLVDELTQYYSIFNPIMSRRVITPFSYAASDDVIMTYFDSSPVNLDDEYEEELVDDMKKDILSNGKKKTKPRKSFTENEKIRKRNESVSSVSSMDLSIEKNVSVDDVNNTSEELNTKTNGWVKVLDKLQKQNKIVQARLKLINDIRENPALLASQPESFTKLIKKDASKQDTSLPSSNPSSPILQNNNINIYQAPSSPSNSRKYEMNTSFAEYPRNLQTAINITVNSKLSQKQRKKLAKDSVTLAEHLDKLNMKKSPWEKTEESSPVLDTSIAKNPWQKIESVSEPLQTNKKQFNFCDIIEDERKQKENFSKMMAKPLLLTQLEDKAIEELSKFYNASLIDDERITVRRVACYQIAAPQWIKKTLNRNTASI